MKQPISFLQTDNHGECSPCPVPRHRRTKERKQTALFGALLAGILVLAFAGTAPSQEVLVKAGGTLTSVESDGTVVINGKGYPVSPAARVLNDEGASAFLSDYDLPSRVYYEYTAQGAEIRMIREIPQ